MSNVEKNRSAQRELYGAPLEDLLGRCTEALGLSQARIASLLGISAPMLSQLRSGHRIKIGNPLAARRLHVMLEGVDSVISGDATVDDVTAKVAAISTSDLGTATTKRETATERTRSIQALFRRQAAAIDYLTAADQLADQFPDIAELLRVYGAGRESDATMHYVEATDVD